MIGPFALLQFLAQTASSSTWGSVQDTSDRSYRISSGIDMIVGGEPEAAGYEADLVATMDYLQEHPYDLNTVTLEELQSIPGLLPAEAAAIVALRRRLKHFTSAAQLLLLEEDGEGVLYRLSPFVFVKPRTTDGPSVLSARSRFRTDTRSPTLERDDLGGPETIVERLTLSPSATTSMGIVMEKEAGERVSDGFLSGYLDAQDLPLISEIVLGDYVVESGQGLVLWRNRYSPKGGSSASSARRLPLGVRSYHSASELGYLRGAALVFGTSSNSRVTCSVFASRRLISGTLDGEGNLKTVDEAGLFRTEQELSRRSVASERLIGGRSMWSIADGIVTGVTWYRSWFDHPVVVDERAGLKKDVFEAMGVDAMAGFERLHLFGEMAKSNSGGLAIVVGSLVSVPPGGSLVMLWRGYGPSFNNPHAGGFSEKGETRNEEGFHIGWALGGSVRITGFFDQYRFPGGTHSTVLPVGGNDLAIRVEAACSRDVAVSLRVSRRVAEVTTSGADAVVRATPALCEQTSHLARVTLRLRAGRGIESTTQGEWRSTSPGAGSAGSILQEVRCQFTPRLSLTARVMLFDTGVRGSPLYQLEGDVPGAYANPSLSGNGRRWYAVVQWRTASWLELGVKYSVTESVTAAGADRPGSSQNVLMRSFAAQLDVRL